MNIFQLKQEQVPNFPFTFYRGLGLIGETTPIVTDHQGRYLIVPTHIAIALDGGDQDQLKYIGNTLLKMAQMKGFTHLMLIYV